MNMIEYFRRGVALNPARTMLIDGRNSLSYSEVSEMAERIAAGLQELGLGDDARVAVLSPNDARAFVAVIGIIRAGLVWTPVNVRNAAEANAAFLQVCGCSCILYHSSMAVQVEEIARRCPKICRFVCIDADGTSLHLSLSQLMSLTPRAAYQPVDDPDRVVIIGATGGTTGRPKAVPLTNAMWRAYVGAALACMPVRGPCSYLVAGPMTHGAGVNGLLLLSHGVTLVILEKPNPVAILDAIERHAITHLFTAPTMVNMLLECPALDTTDLSSLQSMVIAASPISPDRLRAAVERFGASVCQSFGQTEAPMFLTFLSNHDLTRAPDDATIDRFASCGRATDGNRVEIMDDAGRLLPPMERGEIVARGDLVFPGYYDDPIASAEASAFGWHHTGDVGFKDKNGFVYIVDRKKDMIVTGGLNVFSVEVEAVLLSHASVRECAVVGVPDPRWGEAIKAVVELKDGMSVTEQELQHWVRERLGGVSTPKSVEIWDDLPRSTNGKILKRAIRETFWMNTNRSVG